jgi:acetyl esterase/lipase
VYYFQVAELGLLAGPFQSGSFATTPTRVKPLPAADGVVSVNNERGKPQPPYSRPIGYVLVIHGGGWQAVGKATVVEARPEATFFQKRGWATYNVDYRRGEDSLADVTATYHELIRRVGRNEPVCVFGGSAGGNLAMLLAATVPSVNCVISEGGPTDLTDYDLQDAFAPPGVPGVTGPTWIFDNFVVRSFGTGQNLAYWSPAKLRSNAHARMLLGGSSYDDLVPEVGQMREMKAADPRRVETMLLPGALTPVGGTANFVHASVTLAALADFTAAEVRLLAWETTSAHANARRAAKHH